METFALVALCECTSDRWILLTKAGNAELWCFLWNASEQTVVQTIEVPVNWDAIALIMTLGESVPKSRNQALMNDNEYV